LRERDALSGEPRGGWVGDEEPAHGPVELVGEVLREELRVDLLAALHYEAADTASMRRRIPRL
jgi:hypothetical protein